ncbi:MAG: TetR/AcrR family transcriptional regulator [Myxococcaceae bacterium]|nr:TetR/AcrR family transcriptional regulator [Myxococcaceae bacterium]
MRSVRGRRQPTTVRGELTKQHLLTAAEQVFAQHGFAHGSVQDITRRAGVALGTFYIYYPNKEALFLELVDTLGERLQRYVAAKTAPVGHGLERQRVAFRAFFEFAAQTPSLYRMVRQADLVDEAVYRAYYERLAKAYADVLEQSMAEGSVTRFTPRVLAWVLMGIADFVGQRFVVWEDEPDVDAFLDEVVAFVEAGLTAKREPRRAG